MALLTKAARAYGRTRGCAKAGTSSLLFNSNIICNICNVKRFQ
nr:MAG TPA: hypothetical protein [Caudoviricetes sp.]